jgi:hypothetical protein
LLIPLATQGLLAHQPWQIGALLLVVLALAMLPAAYWSSGADKLPGQVRAKASPREVLGQAMRNRSYVVMSGAYFVCTLTSALGGKADLGGGGRKRRS